MSWKKVKITDVCEFQGGTQPPKSEWVDIPTSGYLRILQIRDFTQSGRDFKAYVRDKKTLKKCESDDILIGRYGASIGKILTGLSGAYNVAIVKTIPVENILEKRFLYYILIGSDFQHFISNIGNRAAQAGFNKRDLEDFKFPLPDLRTQQQIVAVLDKAQGIIDKRKKSIQLLEELLKATFLDMFGDPVLNEMGWKIAKLSDLGNWHSGGTPLRSNEKYFKGTIPWYSSGELNDIYTSESKERISEEAITATSAKLVKKESLLIGMYDTAALKSSITTMESSCNQAIAFARLDDNKSRTLYVYFAIQLGREHYLTQRRGVRQRNLNLSMVKNFELPLPSLEAQIKFENNVQKLFIFQEKINGGLKKSRDLFQSLLQDAFAGKLRLKKDLPLEVILEQYRLGDMNPREKLFNEELVEYLANSDEKLKKLKHRIDRQGFVDSNEYEKGKTILFEVLNASNTKIEQHFNKRMCSVELKVK